MDERHLPMIDLPDNTMKVTLAVLLPCPHVSEEQRSRGVTCDMFANGTQCFSGGECSEAEGGRWVVTDVEVVQLESPFVVVGHDNPEGPSMIARKDGWYPVKGQLND